MLTHYAVNLVTTIKKACFTDSLDIKDAEWFDKECLLGKTRYLDALKVFNLCKSDVNREWFITCKAEYKSLVKRKRGCSSSKQFHKLKSYERANQNSFGGILNPEKANPEEFQWMHFMSILKKLSSDITVLANDEADQLYSSHDFSGDDATFPELDQPITVSEITEAVKTLKTCKLRVPLGFMVILAKYEYRWGLW